MEEARVHLFEYSPPEWLSRFSPDFNGGLVLDLGAGDGANSYHLKNFFRGSTIISIDISKLRCTTCKRIVGTSVLLADAFKIPLKNECVDFVVCTQMIEHVLDDLGLLKGISRVMKPESPLFLSSIVRRGNPFYIYKNQFGERVLEPTHLREYTSDLDFKKLISTYFNVQHMGVYKVKFSPIRFIYRLLIRIKLVRKRDPTVFLKNPILRILAKLKIAIPRYFIVEAIAIKK